MIKLSLLTCLLPYFHSKTCFTIEVLNIIKKHWIYDRDAWVSIVTHGLINRRHHGQNVRPFQSVSILPLHNPLTDVTI